MSTRADTVLTVYLNQEDPRIDDGLEEGEDDCGDHPIEADGPGLKDDDASHEVGYRGDLAEDEVAQVGLSILGVDAAFLPQGRKATAGLRSYRASSRAFLAEERVGARGSTSFR